MTSAQEPAERAQAGARCLAAAPPILHLWWCAHVIEAADARCCSRIEFSAARTRLHAAVSRRAGLARRRKAGFSTAICLPLRAADAPAPIIATPGAQINTPALHDTGALRSSGFLLGPSRLSPLPLIMRGRWLALHFRAYRRRRYVQRRASAYIRWAILLVVPRDDTMMPQDACLSWLPRGIFAAFHRSPRRPHSPDGP